MNQTEMDCFMRGRLMRAAHETQVGGTHYKDMAIQPADFILQNNLGWAEGTAIAYIARWRQKGGVQDLKKAIHTLELLIESEGPSTPVQLR